MVQTVTEAAGHPGTAPRIQLMMPGMITGRIMLREEQQKRQQMESNMPVIIFMMIQDLKQILRPEPLLLRKVTGRKLIKNVFRHRSY